MTYQPSSEEAFALRAERLLDSLAKDAERRGWTFLVAPQKSALPEFLGDYRPDAIVLNSEGGVIIEITNRRDIAQKGRLAEVAKIVSGQRGWSFRVFYANPSDQPRASFLSPTSEEVITGINEARALDAMGQERAALVMAWAALEAVARLVMSQADIDSAKPISPIQAVQTLAQEGYLSDEDAAQLRDLARIRNEVVHGGLSVRVSREEVGRLIENLESISEKLQNAA